jgi:hypothetical protein
MAVIQDLSPELVTSILDYIGNLQDVHRLCIVSKYFNNVLTPKLYHTIKIPTANIRQLLQTILQRRDLAALVKKIEMEPGTPSDKPPGLPTSIQWLD